jgi:hypothetical protein
MEALQAARGPWSVCMIVVPLRTVAVARRCRRTVRRLTGTMVTDVGALAERAGRLLGACRLLEGAILQSGARYVPRPAASYSPSKLTAVPPDHLAQLAVIESLTRHPVAEAVRRSGIRAVTFQHAHGVGLEGLGREGLHAKQMQGVTVLRPVAHGEIAPDGENEVAAAHREERATVRHHERAMHLSEDALRVARHRIAAIRGRKIRVVAIR